MWKDFSADTIGIAPMAERKRRFLAFIDYLGTGSLYFAAEINAEIIEDRRSELEHAVQTLLQSDIVHKRIEIGVFSDTLLIAGEHSRDVLRCSALIFNSIFKKTLNRRDWADVRLVRGSVANGIELRTTYLRPAPGVSVIPFYDSSLAFTAKTENIRRGSRLFLSTNIREADLNELAEFVFNWEFMSGIGVPTTDIKEFLWPAYIYQGKPNELADTIVQAFEFWRNSVTTQNLSRAEYQETLYHLDETIKNYLRSLAVARPSEQLDVAVQKMVSTILPSEKDIMNDCPINFVWGFWFQALYVLARLGLVSQHIAALTLLKRELNRRKYLDKFIAEAEYPDYAFVAQALASKPWKDL